MIISLTSALEYIPKRIVSLVPSQTELLYTLGLDEQTTGITKFCIHPDQWFRTKTRIGGTKTVNIELIKTLNPDLIIANKEENVKEQIEVLAKEYPVWVTDVNNFEEALQMINDIGTITNKEDEFKELIEKIQSNFVQLQQQNTLLQTGNCQLRAAYLIWRNPYMTIGGDTFINDMLKKCGLENIFQDQKRYPEITLAQLQAENCQLLLLSSEPYPFKQKHIDELQAQLPDCKIMLVDGEMFSWYGSRMFYAAEYFKQLRSTVGA